MPRGKNYVNNNQGVTMQASKKKKAPSMEQCFYGKGCTRANCFYRHDGPGTSGEGEKSAEPCMPFLAGLCTFSAGGCRKRHPGKAEAEKLIAKYKQTKCRYGKHCKTAGCLYIHPGAEEDADKLGGTAAFPPLAGANGAVPRPVAPTGAWKPMQPTGAAVVSAVPGLSAPRPPPPPQQQQQQAPVKSAWQPSPPQPASAWGKPGRNPVLVNHSNSNPSNPATSTRTTPVTNGNIAGAAAVVTPLVNNTNGMSIQKLQPQTPAARQPPKLVATVAAATTPPPPPPAVSTTTTTTTMSFAAAAAPPPPTQPRRAESPRLNIHAKEFVPGNNY